MPSTIKTLILAAAIAVFSPLAQASCFDFSSRVVEPMSAPQPLKTEGTIGEASGQLDGGRVWASAQGTIDHATSDLFQDLLTHRATRAAAAKKMDLKTLDDKKNDLQQVVEFTVKPFPLVTVQWLEHWTYNVTKGSMKDPETIVVAYEKTEGTSHIEHLCGTLKLEKTGASETRVTLYEEVKATRRTQQDTLNGVTGTLRELRDLKVAAKSSEPETGVKSATTTSSDRQ